MLPLAGEGCAAAGLLCADYDAGQRPAKTPAQFAHDALVGGDPAKLNLGDKEFILANGVKEDADKLWAVLKDQVTPVPGKVIEASASVIKVAVTPDAKVAKVAKMQGGQVGRLSPRNRCAP